MSTAQKQTSSDAATKVAADGLGFAYRDGGNGAVPLVLLQHFRGNLDNWDLCPDSAHGFLFQHSTEFAPDVEQFLHDNDIGTPTKGGSDE